MFSGAIHMYHFSKFILNTMAFVGIVFASSYANAGANGCGRLGVQILNHTNTLCVVKNIKMIKGEVAYMIPNITVLPPNVSQTIFIEQAWLSGPDMIVDYECGSKKISIESQQNYCLFQSGDVHGQIVSVEGGLRATYAFSTGSYSQRFPGHIYWEFE
jgi:hypothetical protein